MRKRRVDQRTWMTWQEAYCEAVADEAETRLGRLIFVVAALALLMCAVRTPWVGVPAAVAGLVVLVRALRWFWLGLRARLGLLNPPD
ncbi:hypothetical protein [Amycolatopsis sp. NPDC054798]